MARGARPASIALKGDHGYYRTFPVVGAGGSPLTNWIANVNDTLPADTYTILDSDLFTWSQNLQSGGRGFPRVYGTFVAAPPPPPGHAPPPPHLAAFGFPSLNGYFVGQCFKGIGLSGNGIDCSGKTSADAFSVTAPFAALTRAAASYLRCFALQGVTCQR
jgi:hypothetical protein